MKAVVFEAIGSPLAITDMPEPRLGTGEVIVDVAAARLLAYAHEIFSGARDYPLLLPAIPGAGGIGRVRAVGPDATRLAPGDWVYCDATIRARDDAVAPDIMLQGLIAPGDGPAQLNRHYRHGSFAEQTIVPTENVTPIGDIAPDDAADWCAMGTLLVPYGGFLAVDLEPGETVVVSGATGSFGSAAVAVALGMGAASVVATGRNEAALADLNRRFGDRVRTAAMSGNEETDRQRILDAAPGPIDVVFDILPPAASPEQVRAAVLTARPGGRVALMGGVGMAGGSGLELPYAWLMRNNITVRGQWMYPRDAARRMAALIRAGLIDLGAFNVARFTLDQVNDAVAHAATHAGPFQMTTLVIDR